MMKFLTQKTLCLAIVGALVVAGCQRKEDPKDEPVAEAPKPNMLMPNCDDASVKNALVRKLSESVGNDIALYITDYPEAGELGLDQRISERLPEIGIDLQKVGEKDGVCQTELHIALPNNDISYANHRFARTGEPSVAERVIDAGLTLNNNHLVAPVAYQISGDTVVLVDKPAVLSLVAQIATAATYTIAKNERSSIHIARPAQPTLPARPTPKPRPEPISQTPADVSAQEYAEQQGVHIESTQDTADTTPMPTPSSEPKKAKKPTASEAKFDDGDVGDSGAEITIVELDETY